METSKPDTVHANRSLSRVARLGSWVFILLPPTLGFFYVRLFGVTVAYGDQWRIAHLFGKLSSGTLTLAPLWNQLNEHRIFVPRVVMLSLGNFTKWNNVAEMYVTQTLLLIALFVLFAVFRTSVVSRWNLLLFIPISLLVFSLRQAETMLMGLLMQFALVLTFAVLTFYFLEDLRQRASSKFALSAALASATLASLSSAHGLLVWPAGLAQLLVSAPGGKRTKLLLSGAWALAGAAVWIIYFVDYHAPTHTARQLAGDPDAGPLYLLRFFVTSMGASLFWWQMPALVIGSLLLAFIVVGLSLILRRGKLAESSFWVALLVFTFLVLLSITVGRSERGIDQALVSRYTTYSVLGVVGLYAILAKLLTESRSRLTVVVFGAALFIIVLSTPITYGGGVKVGAATEASRNRAALVLATYESQPDSNLASLYPNPEVVRKRASVLERLGYNVFSEPFRGEG